MLSHHFMVIKLVQVSLIFPDERCDARQFRTLKRFRTLVFQSRHFEIIRACVAQLNSSRRPSIARRHQASRSLASPTCIASVRANSSGRAACARITRRRNHAS